MKSIDFEAMSPLEIEKCIEEGRLVAKRKREAEFEEILNEFVHKAKQMGVDVPTVIERLQKSQPQGKVQKTKGANAALKLTGYLKDTVYINPEDSNAQWKGGSKGPKPSWLLEQFASNMTAQDRAAKFLVLAKK